jgi:hypothetical protein
MAKVYRKRNCPARRRKRPLTRRKHSPDAARPGFPARLRIMSGFCFTVAQWR